MKIGEYIIENGSVDTLKLGGVFRTDLPEEQQINGNYGLDFTFIGV